MLIITTLPNTFPLLKLIFSETILPTIAIVELPQPFTTTTTQSQLEVVPPPSLSTIASLL